MPSERDLLDHLATAVLLVDANLEVTFVNQAAASMIGRSEGRCIGEPIAALIKDHGASATTLAEAIETRQPFTRRGAELRSAAGEPFRVDYTVIPIEDAALVEIQALDRFARIDRENSRATARTTAQQLVRGLAHEIKNPLGGIKGAAQLLRRALPDPALAEYTSVIVEETDRLTQLVDQMLGPRDSPNWADVNVHHVLEHVITVLTAELNSAPSAPTVKRDYDPSLPAIRGDFDRLTQAFLNVMRNAAQALATTPDPTIVVTSRVVRQHTIAGVRHRLVIRIDVTDNGPGVPGEIADQLFFPMISGRADGTGLGLAITQNIVALHRGALEYSCVPGSTTFSFYLPLEQPHE